MANDSAPFDGLVSLILGTAHDDDLSAQADVSTMANGSATFDGLFSLILGTGDDDVLSAQADGDIVLGLAGNDHLNSTFNLTALIGGDGEDTLTTNVIVPLQSDAPGHGIAIQFGETGNDNLDATVTLQGAVSRAQHHLG